jgi:hypothetical protein
VPVAGAKVRFEVPPPMIAVAAPEERPDREDLPASIEAITDEGGTFVVNVPDHVLPHAVCHAVVTSADAEVLFAGHVRVTDGMVILVPEVVRLHGQVLGISDVCPGSGGFALIQEIGAQPAQICGHGQLDADGRFFAISRTVRSDLPVRLRAGCAGTVYTFDTDVETLSSPQGGRFLLEMRPLNVRVVDELGAPVADAHVAAATPETRSTSTIVRATTGVDGVAILRLPSGIPRVIVAAVAPGRRQALCAVEDTNWPAELYIELARLSPDDVLEGHVRDSNGLPVADAVVTALPRSDASSVKTLQPGQTRTDGTGHFELQVGGEIDFELTAFTRANGMSRRLLVRAPRRDLEIVVPGAQVLRIHAVAPDGAASSRGGEVEWVLIPHRDGALQSGVDALPITTEPVAAGDYVLSLLWRDLNQYGEALVSVGSERATRDVFVFLREPLWFEGRVSAIDVAKYRVRFQHRTWPDPLRASWATSPCATDGSFKVFAGLEQRGEVEVLDPDGNVVVRGTAQVGTRTYLHVVSR